MKICFYSHKCLKMIPSWEYGNIYRRAKNLKRADISEIRNTEASFIDMNKNKAV